MKTPKKEFACYPKVKEGYYALRDYCEERGIEFAGDDYEVKGGRYGDEEIIAVFTHRIGGLHEVLEILSKHGGGCVMIDFAEFHSA